MSASFKTSAGPDALRVFDHKVQRRIVGFVAILLAPIVCVLSSEAELLSSISSYYWSDAGGIFVAALAVVAMFLSAYNGTGGSYDWEFFLAKAGGFFALIVALFPTSNHALPALDAAQPPAWTVAVASWLGLEPHNLHIAAAIALFLVLAALLLIFSVRAKAKGRTRRSGLYRAFAGALIVGLLFAGVHIYCRSQNVAFLGLNNPSVVFYLEAYMLTVFGVAWLLAGFYQEADGEQQGASAP